MEANFHGSLDHFRSLMSYLRDQQGGREWTLPSGARLVIEERPPSDPTISKSWVVSLPLDVDGSNRRHAVIQAFSRGENSAVVILQDGRTISPNPHSLGEIQVLGPDRAIGPAFGELCQELQRHMNDWAPPPTEPPTGSNPTPVKDPGDGHFAYPLEKRRAIVQHYRADRRKGIITNKDRWACHRYNISGKTLQRYEREFPQPPPQTSTDT
jgi:hypothetical protein